MSSVRRDGEQVDKSQSIRILNKQIVYNIETINWWGLLSLAMDSRLSFRQAYYIAVQSLAGWLAGWRTHARMRRRSPLAHISIHLVWWGTCTHTHEHSRRPPFGHTVRAMFSFTGGDLCV